MDKYPYFFRYRYKDCKKKYDKYIDSNEGTCRQKFKMSLKSLINLDKKTPEQMQFLDNYYRYMPVTMSNSPMNMLCRYIESVNFEISKKIKEDNSYDIIKTLKYNIDYSDDDYKMVAECLDRHFLNNRGIETFNYVDKEVDCNNGIVDVVSDFTDVANEILSRVNDLSKAVNCVVDYFYLHNPSKNKDVMWAVFGKYIFNKLKKEKNKIFFPIPNKNGDIKYLGETYSLQEIDI